MSIVSSIITNTDIQKDNRRWIRELHTDQVGIKYIRQYLAGSSDDVNASLSAYATVLAALINLNEIVNNVNQVMANGSLATITFIYSTMAENRQALRNAYSTALRTEAIMIGDFLSSLTDAQLQTIFSMTSGQVTTLRNNKLTPAVTQATAIRAAAGQ